MSIVNIDMWACLRGQPGTSLCMVLYDPPPSRESIYPRGIENTTVVSVIMRNRDLDMVHLGRFYMLTAPAREFDWHYSGDIVAWALPAKKDEVDDES